MKNIAFLIYDTSIIGGAENISIDLANTLSKEYNTHIISVFSANKQAAFPINDTCKQHLLSPKVISITKNIYSLSKKCREIIKKEKIDLIISVTPGIISIASIASTFLDTKHIFWEHSNLENQTYGKKHLLRQYIGASFADKIITLTKRDMNNYINRFRINENRITYIYNYFKPSRIVKDYNIDSKEIVTVGRLKSVKGYDRLVEVAKLVFEHKQDWQWHIYGDGDQEKFLLEKIKEYKLEKNLILKGLSKEIDIILPKYSMFVLTSYYEGLPLVLLEAKTASLPIISFDCPTGPSEIINNNENGYIVENGNIREMAKKILDLIEDKEKRIYFSKNSDNNLYLFDKENIVEIWKKEINLLLNKDI